MELKMFVCGATSAGRKPGQNEDAFLIGDKTMTTGEATVEIKPPFIFAVADGVSGEESGEVASATALSVLSAIKMTPKTDPKKIFLDIHKFLKAQGVLKNSPNMQTTLCAAFVYENKLTLCNVGDSRLFLCRGGKLTQISRDQSLAQLLFEQGQLTRAQKRVFSHKNVILPALGNVTDDPVPETAELDLISGDIIILCTDGFSDYVKAHEAESILALPENLKKRVAKLCDRAYIAGSKDKIPGVAAVV
jgi:protein phosphatase